MTYVYKHTESLCESTALHNWFIFSSDAPHQGRSPEVQGLQNSLNTTCNKTLNPACASISKHSKWRKNTDPGELYGWTHPKGLSNDRMN